MSPWTFLSNHGHVLLAVARNPDVRVDDLAGLVGISPRATLGILGDLEEAGCVTRTRSGRRTHYTIDPDQPMRHPTSAHHHVGEILEVLTTAPEGPEARTAEQPLGDVEMRRSLRKHAAQP